MAKEAIVVADDDKVVVMLVSEFLRRNGFHVVLAFDSMQAMQGVRQAKPRAVILDIAMPGGTGVDVLKKLKTMNTTSDIPVIILTGSTDVNVKRECLQLGADGFLAKPVDLAALFSALNRALGRPDTPPASPAS